jgi:hypothetical protein
MDEKECISCHKVKKLTEFRAQPAKCKECIENQRRETIERKAIERSLSQLTVVDEKEIPKSVFDRNVLLERMEAKLDKLTAMVQQLLDQELIL